MPEAEKVVVTVLYNDGSQNIATMNIAGSAPTNALTLAVDEGRTLTAVVAPRDILRTYDPSQPVALDDQDPGNTDPDQLTTALDPDDDVYAMVNPDTK